jgi:hypothetical protein
MTKLISLLFIPALLLPVQNTSAPVWKFAVSGDSRNCGDVVMPAIAAAVSRSGANFYWHLGDFRAIYNFDEDMVPPAELHLNTPRLTISSYLDTAWADFIDRQLEPFGKLELFLGIGNHELIFPFTRDAYLTKFEQYLKSPRLMAQRQQDGDKETAPRTYYHWVMNGSIDFISLDNASANSFDETQLAWLRAVLASDGKNAAIRTVIVGMHEALPGSKGLSHSMCDSADGVRSGRDVYERLWQMQQSGKNVYVLASHSHFVMDDVYRTDYWKGRVLSGWIVGTAGAIRYRLPPGVTPSNIARTDVYGYLLGNVFSDGSVTFSFQETSLDDLRLANAGKMADSLVRWCFAENADQRIPVPGTCGK